MVNFNTNQIVPYQKNSLDYIQNFFTQGKNCFTIGREVAQIAKDGLLMGYYYLKKDSRSLMLKKYAVFNNLLMPTENKMLSKSFSFSSKAGRIITQSMVDLHHRSIYLIPTIRKFHVIMDTQLAKEVLNKGRASEEFDNGTYFYFDHSIGRDNMLQSEKVKHRELRSPFELNFKRDSILKYIDENIDMFFRTVLPVFEKHSSNTFFMTPPTTIVSTFIDNSQKYVKANFYETLLGVISMESLDEISILGALGPESQNQKENKSKLRDLLQRILSDHSTFDLKEGRILEVLKDSKLENEEKISTTLLFIAAGLHSTSSLMNFFLHHLNRAPSIQTRVKKQWEKDYAPHVKDKTTFSEQVQKFLKESVLLEASFLEILRLYPVFPLLIRIAKKDFLIGQTANEKGTVIEEGDDVIVNVFACGRDAAIYGKNPDLFNPDRFISTNFTGQPILKKMKDTQGNDIPILSFSVGPQSCIGQNLAKTQLKLYGLLMMIFCENDVKDSEENRAAFPVEIQGISLHSSELEREINRKKILFNNVEMLNLWTAKTNSPLAPVDETELKNWKNSLEDVRQTFLKNMNKPLPNVSYELPLDKMCGDKTVSDLMDTYMGELLAKNCIYNTEIFACNEVKHCYSFVSNTYKISFNKVYEFLYTQNGEKNMESFYKNLEEKYKKAFETCQKENLNLIALPRVKFKKNDENEAAFVKEEFNVYFNDAFDWIFKQPALKDYSEKLIVQLVTFACAVYPATFSLPSLSTDGQLVISDFFYKEGYGENSFNKFIKHLLERTPREYHKMIKEMLFHKFGKSDPEAYQNLANLFDSQNNFEEMLFQKLGMAGLEAYQNFANFLDPMKNNKNMRIKTQTDFPAQPLNYQPITYFNKKQEEISRAFINYINEELKKTSPFNQGLRAVVIPKESKVDPDLKFYKFAKEMEGEGFKNEFHFVNSQLIYILDCYVMSGLIHSFNYNGKCLRIVC
jgi:cytochrome P450